ncbi:MAG: transcriptional regulator [Sporichthyaceae bacterium]
MTNGTNRVLAALADGRILPAGTLAAEAELAPRAVAAALEALGSDVVALECGRWTYYRLAPGVPRPRAAEPIASLRPGTALYAVRAARRCWGHPAGRLGVALTDALRSRGFVEGHDGNVDLLAGDRPRMSGGVADDATYRLTSDGADYLARLGFPAPRRRESRPCIDWTEQRHHLAGDLGRCLLDGLLARGWVVEAATPRALDVTDAGRRALREHFGIHRSD